MFLYIHLHVSHQKQDSYTNLTNLSSPIYPSILPYIDPHIILYKYSTSLLLIILFLFQTSIEATHWEITPSHFKQ